MEKFSLLRTTDEDCYRGFKKQNRAVNEKKEKNKANEKKSLLRFRNQN